MKTLADLHRANQSVTSQLRRNAIALKSDLLRREVEKKTRTSIDAFEEKAMRDTATGAAAAGSPEQAKAMLRKARGKLMTAAANGADTVTLEAMVRDFERLTKIAEEKRDQAKAQERKSKTPEFTL
jgi:type III secretory pathway component EscV